MLEKNKDYVEMRVSSTDYAFTQNEPTSICIDGYVYTPYIRLPDPGELYILISKEKFEKMQADNQHYREMAKQWEENYNLLLKKTGFETVECLIFYLTNIGKCDTLHGAINWSNNSWKAAAECNSPKELIEKLNLLRDDISGRSTVIEHYKRDIEKWQNVTGYSSPEEYTGGWEAIRRLCEEIYKSNGDTESNWQKATGCPTPVAAKTLIESGMAYEHGFHEAQEENRKLTEEVDSWKNVTGYSTPEDYMHARINCATPFDLTAVWQDATGCVTPDQVKSRIEGLENAVRLTNRNMIKEIESNIDEWQKFTGCDSPQKAGCKINSLCDEICKLKGDYDHLLELTGYKNEKGICAALVFSDENHLYITMRDLINSLKRKAKFTESNWQNATGCDTPGAAEGKLENYKECVDNARYAAKCTKNYLDNITF